VNVRWCSRPLSVSSSPLSAWRQAWQEQGTTVEQRLEFIQSVLAHPPAAPPGTAFLYSNQGYAVVGAMLEKVAGQSWEELITTQLFQPLKMHSAGFGTPPGDNPWGHHIEDGVITPIRQDNPPAIAPAGRVHCTLDDLARFTMLHMDGTESAVLSPASIARLHTPPGDGKEGMACGWHRCNRAWAGSSGTALTHTGSNTMWYVMMWVAPQNRFAVVIGTNIASGEYDETAFAALDEVAGHMIRAYA
jgi:CubicO group peptidase (beta-lactamase class C family)